MPLLLTNAMLVLPDRMVSGCLEAEDGCIKRVAEGHTALANAEDCGGDLLMPGLVDLHTDNLERQVQPRTNTRWPSASAYLAHDAQCAAAGITTVFDALCVGDLGYEAGRRRTLLDGLADGPALAAAGLLKARHLLHLRCELPAPDMQELLEPAGQQPGLAMVSLMDHTPGFGQHADLAPFRRLRRMDGMADAAIEALIGTLHAQRAAWRQRNEAYLFTWLGTLGRIVAVASHDDRTADEVHAARATGARISEFPVSLEAARAARANGMDVIAGAPNLVRGGSHSGNVAVHALLEEGVVDALASDYVPCSLAGSIFLHGTVVEGVARVTARPAAMAGLADRGRLEPGLLADLVRVRPPVDGLPPAVVAVWRSGIRIA